MEGDRQRDRRTNSTDLGPSESQSDGAIAQEGRQEVEDAGHLHHRAAQEG